MTKLKACSLKYEKTRILVLNQVCESAIHSPYLGPHLLISNGQNAHSSSLHETVENVLPQKLSAKTDTLLGESCQMAGGKEWRMWGANSPQFGDTKDSLKICTFWKLRWRLDFVSLSGERQRGIAVEPVKLVDLESSIAIYELGGCKSHLFWVSVFSSIKWV